MNYNSDTRKFTIYSEDEELIGERAITLSAHLEDFPTVTSPSPNVSTTIEVVQVLDAC